jgi:hypothetical protein
VLALHRLVPAAVRGIQTCPAEIPEVERSVGAIRGTLAEAADRARGLRPAPTGPLRVLADEPFAGRRPALAAVDHASGLVAVLQPAEAADETTRSCARLELPARGA